MEHRSIKATMMDGMSRMVNELARFRRMVELNSELHEMTVEEFDDLLNKMCEEAHEKYESMSLGEIMIDGLVNALAADAKWNGSEATGKKLADLFKGMGDE